MIIRTKILKNGTSIRLSVDKRDADVLGMDKSGEMWEIDILRPITKETIKKEREERFNIPKEEINKKDR